MMNTSVAWGFPARAQGGQGTYRTVSTKDAVFDSQTAAFVTGGKNDNPCCASMTRSSPSRSTIRDGSVRQGRCRVRQSQELGFGIRWHPTLMSGAGAAVHQR